MIKNHTSAKSSTPYSDACLARVYKDLVRRINWKFPGLRDTIEDAEGIAAQAIGYALKPGLAGTGTFPATESELLANAWTVAKWRLGDTFDRTDRNPVKFSVDDPVIDDEGSEQSGENHPYCDRFSIELEKQSAFDRRWHETGRKAYVGLVPFLAGAGFSHRDIRVYDAYKLQAEPTEVVSDRFDVTVNNIYQIAHRIGDYLAECGRRLIAA